MIKTTFLLLLLAAVATRADELIFKKRGELVRKVDLSAIAKELKVEPEVVDIFEPHESREKKYKGFNFTKLLQAVYGDDWKKAEEILFTCVDGYQPSIPLARFKSNTSFLTFELPGAAFKVNNKFQNEKEIPLGPFYLVWENMKNQKIREEGAEGWPYQVNTVDLIQFGDRFPRLAPGEKASPQAKRGFIAFRKHCLSCHTVNGEGGSKGVELNYPASVTEYFKESWLEKWMLDPTSIRFNTTMPALTDKTALKDIVAYLKTMAKRKQPPAEKKD